MRETDATVPLPTHLPRRSMRAARRAALACAALVAAGVGCGGAPEAEPTAPAVLRLAREYRPEEATRTLTFDIERDEWNGPDQGAFSVRRPLCEVPGGSGDDLELWAGEYRLERTAAPAPDQDAQPAPSGRTTWFERDDRVWIVPGEDGVPQRAALRVRTALGRASGDAWRVDLAGYSAEGIALAKGDVVTLRVDVPPDALLRCTTAFVGRGQPGGARRGHLRILLDDQPLLEWHPPAREAPHPEVHELPLPGERIGAELRIELTGAPGVAALLTPRICRAAPPRAARPDVVFLLADTFRADNLAAWGGDPLLTPELNRLAEGALRFKNAQTAATWTLPSHAAFFTGLYPRQVGVTDRSHSLPPAAHTLAEHFADAGYRTVAVTERGYVSRTYGMEQGFEWFEERAGEVEETVANALAQVDARDGRPLFLFVHSYRAHFPYRVSDVTRNRLSDHDFDGDNTELAGAIGAFGEQAVRGRPVTGELRRLVGNLERMYRGASADLDAGFGELLRGLEERGVLPGAVLLLTSDHGESFGEHGVLFHSASAWREEAHIPLLVRAPDLAPGDVDDVVSLTDLPRTLAALAGLEPAPEWGGRALVGAACAQAPVAVYQCGPDGESDVALTDGRRKLIYLDEPSGAGEVQFAYDLTRDAAEAEDCAGEPWVRDQRDAWTEDHLGFDRAVLEAGAASLGADQARELRELGYGGGE